MGGEQGRGFPEGLRGWRRALGLCSVHPAGGMHRLEKSTCALLYPLSSREALPFRGTKSMALGGCGCPRAYECVCVCVYHACCAASPLCRMPTLRAQSLRCAACLSCVPTPRCSAAHRCMTAAPLHLCTASASCCCAGRGHEHASEPAGRLLLQRVRLHPSRLPVLPGPHQRQVAQSGAGHDDACGEEHGGPGEGGKGIQGVDGVGCEGGGGGVQGGAGGEGGTGGGRVGGLRGLKAQKVNWVRGGGREGWTEWGMAGHSKCIG